MTPLPRLASCLPASNCGLISATTLPKGFTNAIAAGNILRNEMKEQSITARSAGRNGCGNCPGRQRPRVQPFHDHDPGIVAPFPVELPCPTSTGILRGPRGANSREAPSCTRSWRNPTFYLKVHGCNLEALDGKFRLRINCRTQSERSALE